MSWADLKGSEAIREPLPSSSWGSAWAVHPADAKGEDNTSRRCYYRDSLCQGRLCISLLANNPHPQHLASVTRGKA